MACELLLMWITSILGRFVFVLCFDSVTLELFNNLKELEKLKNEGLVRSIGVSNFNEYQLNRVIKKGPIPPAVNQIEVHPYLTQSKLVEFCQKNGVAVTGYCPLGTKAFPR